MRHKTSMSRGKRLFPGLAALPAPCGRVVFHGDKPSFTVERPFSVETSKLVRATINDPKWWKSKAVSGRISTLSGWILALDRLLVVKLEGSKSLATTLHRLPNPHQSNIPTRGLEGLQG